MAKRIQLNEAQLKQIIKEAVQAAIQQQGQQPQQTGYKILVINQPGVVSINGRPCNRGDVFQDPSQLQWAQGVKGAVKVLDLSNKRQYVLQSPGQTPTPEQQKAQQAAQKKYKLATAPVINKFVSPETQANLYNQAYPGTRNPHIVSLGTR